jgi:membrane protease YdiL (CAAX protease family)
MNYFEIAKQGRNKWYWYVLGIVLMFIFINAFGLPIGILSSEGYNFSKNEALLMNLLPFLGGFIGILLAIKYIHKKPVISIFTSNKKFNYTKFVKAIFIWFALSVIFEYTMSKYTGFEYVFNFNLEKFLPLLLISIVFIPFQAGMEELLFRGYLFQGINLVTKNKIVSLLVCASVFGLMHLANPEVAEHGILLTLPTYIFMGLILGLVVVLDNGLETALGIHIINNIYACVIVTFPESALQTDAIFISEKLHPLYSMIGLVLMSSIFLTVNYRKSDFKLLKSE